MHDAEARGQRKPNPEPPTLIPVPPNLPEGPTSLKCTGDQKETRHHRRKTPKAPTSVKSKHEAKTSRCYRVHRLPHTPTLSFPLDPV
ncbi:hypothetical protein BRADI_2g46355v3 [Brachypodium distachyon]|uniref:Uncharacterized protein n=1 Tax=Brachypodium distachyon TaxID=15368 RepID=A0A2K2DE30_BRADI|nr:hypothetical protein BRADI_2g46355v3 [Brachypodium distachyon]